MNVLIADTGLWARDVAEAIEEGGVIVDGYVEFYDGRRCRSELLRLKKPILWYEDAIIYTGSHGLIHGLGTQNREHCVGLAHSIGFRFGTYKHPTARVPKSCKLGAGVYIGPGVIMGSDCIIGDHVTINRGAIIGHDVQLGPFVNVSPGANIAGLAKVGRGTYVAMGSCILDTKQVGDYCIVGAGAVVTKNYGNNVQLLGVPARITKEHIRGK